MEEVPPLAVAIDDRAEDNSLYSVLDDLLSMEEEGTLGHSSADNITADDIKALDGLLELEPPKAVPDSEDVPVLSTQFEIQDLELVNCNPADFEREEYAFLESLEDCLPVSQIFYYY